MNLLRAAWISVHGESNGQSKKLTLQQLLCSDDRWSLALPRDDLEFAALQLLICMVQVLFPSFSVAPVSRPYVSTPLAG